MEFERNPWQMALRLLLLTPIALMAQESDSPFGFESEGKAAVREKINSIILPTLEFSDTPFDLALEYLQSRSFELDHNETEPEKRGVNIVLDSEVDVGPLITLRLTEVPLVEALRYTTALANAKFIIEEHAILVVPISYGARPPALLHRRDYLLEEEIVGIFEQESPKEALEKVGITFPAGSSASLSGEGAFLTVTNDSDQLELVEAYLTSLLGYPPKRANDDGRADAIRRKLRETVLPEVAIVELPFKDAIAYLQEAAIRHDPSGGLERRGVSMVVDFAGAGTDRRITLGLKNVTLGEALHHVARIAGFTMEVEPTMVAFRPRGKDEQ